MLLLFLQNALLPFHLLKIYHTQTVSTLLTQHTQNIYNLADYQPSFLLAGEDHTIAGSIPCGYKCAIPAPAVRLKDSESRDANLYF